MIYVILGLVAIVGVWLWATYKDLVKAKLRSDEALSDITVQTKRRLDLIPNIVEAVKGYAKHEKGVFTEVTKARTAVLEAPKGELHRLFMTILQMSWKRSSRNSMTA